MRLAVVDDRYPELYGAQENVLILSELCLAAGHEPVFVTIAPGRLATEAEARGLETLVVDAPARLRQFERAAIANGPIASLRYGIDLARYNLTLARALRRLDPDLILVAAVRPALLLVFSRMLLGRPIVLYAQNSISFGLFAVVAGWISTRIALIGEGARSTFPGWFQRRVAARFVPLPSGRDFARYDRNDVEVHERSETPSDDGPVHLVTICSITERKGIHHLLAVLDDLRSRGVEARLTVVGSTTGSQSQQYDARLRRIVADRDLDVDFAGWLDDVVPVLRQADVFVLASADEGLPGVLLEAMAVGVACVTTRAGSAGELVEGCEAGVAVPIGDTAAFADAVANLVDRPERRTAMANAGYANVRARYSLDAFFERFDAIAAPLVAARAR
ncbi:MAG: glycosyltransferase family 4 protein [Actinomycetota bacterium]